MLHHNMLFNVELNVTFFCFSVVQSTLNKSDLKNFLAAWKSVNDALIQCERYLSSVGVFGTLDSWNVLCQVTVTQNYVH